MTGFGMCIRGGVSLVAVVAASSAIAQVSTPAPPPIAAEEAVVDEAAIQSDDPALRDVVVTGSRLGASGFQAPTPVTVLGTEAVETRAPAAVAELLYELPSFVNNGPTVANRGTTSVGANVLDIHGIGAVRTLVLVDGRRYTPQNTTTVFDTNLIPTGLVSRTEVVTGGASAAYGSDAVAGVVNFILKDRIDGIEGSVQSGISQEGDNQEITLNLAGGTDIGGGVRILAGIDYSKNDGVGYPGRGFYARDWGRNEYGRLQFRGPPSARPANTPANILGANVQFSDKTPGSLILTGPLRGTAFNDSGQPFAFQFGNIIAGNQMQGSNANFGNSVTGRQPLRSAVERFVALGRVTGQLGADTEVFLEGNYATQDGRGNTAQAFIDAHTIFISNPFIPAATRAEMVRLGLTSIQIGRLVEEPGPYMSHNSNRFMQGTAGIKGVIAGFRWDAYYSYGRNKYRIEVLNNGDLPNFTASLNAVRNPVTGVIECAPLTTPNSNFRPGQVALVQPGCVPFNPFGRGAPSAAAIEYTTNRLRQDTVAEQQEAAINFSGDLFALPAGPIAVAFGAEYRRNTAVATVDARSLVSALAFGNPKPIDGRTGSKEAYFEIAVPVFKDSAVGHALDVNGAYRLTDYTRSGTVSTWKLGAIYEPFEGLRFRASRSRDVRAPNIADLDTQGAGGVFSGPLVISQTVTLGNPNLDPEVADNLTAGIVFAPTSFLRGLRISGDYFRIKINDVIATPVPADVFEGCNLRNNQADCANLEGADPLRPTRIFLRPANLNRFDAEGVDMEASYIVATDGIGIPGRFNLRALGTYLTRLETTNALGLSLGNQAGGGIPVAGQAGLSKWRFTFNVGYESQEGFGADVQIRTLSSFKYGSNFVGPEDPGYSPALANSINDNRYPAAAYVNLALRQEITLEGKRRFQVFGNIDNLLDKDPPFGWIQDIGTYDTIGRTFKVGVRFAY